MVRACRLVVAVVAVALVASGCTLKKSEQPPLSGPSELALSLMLFANPDVVLQDGASQSQVVIQARDQSGQPIKNLPLRVEAVSSNPATTAAGRLSAQSVATDSDGRATVTYTAPPAPVGNVDQGTIITIRATPTGTDYATAVPRSVQIRLVPSGSETSGPTAGFTFSPISPATNSTVSFNAAESRSDVAVTSCNWSFGDGTFGTGVTVQHIYRNAGSYTVTLTVSDANGKTSNPVSQVIVVGTSAAPTADFVFSPPSPTPGASIYFNAVLSKAGAGRTIVDYSWNFGEPGPVLKGVTVVKQYALAGSYVVTLTVTDDIGATHTAVKTVTVASAK